jgi:hypothetical protein
VGGEVLITAPELSMHMPANRPFQPPISEFMVCGPELLRLYLDMDVRGRKMVAAFGGAGFSLCGLNHARATSKPRRLKPEPPKGALRFTTIRHVRLPASSKSDKCL